MLGLLPSSMQFVYTTIGSLRHPRVLDKVVAMAAGFRWLPLGVIDLVPPVDVKPQLFVVIIPHALVLLV